MKRIAVGTFENTYVNTVNKVAYASNTVRTTTPEPKKPEEPTTPNSNPNQKGTLPYLKQVQMIQATCHILVWQL